MDFTLNALTEQNPHWRTKQVEKCAFINRRSCYNQIVPWLKGRVSVGIEGLRRTGKSTLLLQLRDQYLSENKIEPINYFYFSFDTEDDLELIPSRILDQVLRLYFSQVLNLEPSLIRSPTLFCFDEIQNIDGWQAVIKKYYDLNPNFKFMFSGSSALFLQDGAESLAGRSMEFRVTPLNFGEFLSFIEERELLTISSKEVLFALPPQQVTARREELFKQFLLVGGFPEAATLLRDGVPMSQVQKYIRDSIVHKVIKKDLTRYFGVRSSYDDLDLFSVLCKETGSEISIRLLADSVGFSEETITKHLSAFERAGLITRLSKFDTKERKRVKAHPKVYVASPSIAMSHLVASEIPLGSYVGHLVEGYVYSRLIELFEDMQIYYAKPTRTTEVDFFLPKEKVALESKYTDSIDDEYYKFFEEISSKFKVKSLLVTKNNWGNQTIKGIPASFL